MFTITTSAKAKESIHDQESTDNKQIVDWPDSVESNDREIILSASLFVEESRSKYNPVEQQWVIFNNKEFDYVNKGESVGQIGRMLGRSICSIYPTIEELINPELMEYCSVNLKIDEFTKDKILESPELVLRNKTSFSLGLENNSAYLRINYSKDNLSLSKSDKIILLLSSGETLSLTLVDNPLRSTEDNKNRICKLKLSINDIEKLSLNKLLKFRVGSANQVSTEIENIDIRFSREITQALLMTISSNFLSRLKEENLVLDEEVSRENSQIDVDTSCYVYIMKDEKNGCHKIGISNHPEYRERTLKSDKPFVTLLQARRFSNRSIAQAFESALHATYKEKNIRGEWFDLLNLK